MKIELFKNMLKEEIRLYTSLYNNSSFFSFPILIAVFTFCITLGFHYLTTGDFQSNNIVQIVLLIFLASGIMAGTFGLQARDYLERRFGEFGKLINNSQILPIDLKTLFITASIKDIVFYMGWFLIPVVLGYGIANFVVGRGISDVPVLFLAILFSFVYGVFLSFFLTFLYERSKSTFVILSIILGTIISYFTLNYGFSNIFFPELFYSNPNVLNFVYMFLVSVILFILITVVVGKEFKTKVRKGRKVKSMKFSDKIDPFLVKDFIDLKRTGGLFSKPFFNVFLPSLFILFIFSSVKYLTEFEIGILFYAIIIGTLSTSLMNALVVSDSVAYYKFLPVPLKKHISNKFLLTILISLVQGLILLIVFGLVNSELNLLFESMILFFMFLVYNINLNFYLTGLNPNEFLLNAKIFFMYAVLLVPVMVIAMILSILFTNVLVYFIVLLILLILISKILFHISIRKWHLMEEIK